MAAGCWVPFPGGRRPHLRSCSCLASFPVWGPGRLHPMQSVTCHRAGVVARCSHLRGTSVVCSAGARVCSVWFSAHTGLAQQSGCAV